MTDLEIKMVELLSELKECYGVTEVKAEFEAEGTRQSELMRLKEIADKARVGLVLKIGGAEAIRDMYEAQLIGVTGIMAPMIESGYAMKKYLAAVESSFAADVKKRTQFSINIETNLAYENLDDILSAPGIERLSGICVGRVDLSGSMGLGRPEINGSAVTKIAKEVFQKARAKGLKNKMGGGISKEALPVVRGLISENLLDFYETRKVVFPAISNAENMEEGILQAAEFELTWLLNKKNYYERLANEDNARIKMMRERLGKP